jgi:hypothetical protein
MSKYRIDYIYKVDMLGGSLRNLDYYVFLDENDKIVATIKGDDKRLLQWYFSNVVRGNYTTWEEDVNTLAKWWIRSSEKEKNKYQLMSALEGE